MTLTPQMVDRIAAPLTGWIVTDEEAKQASIGLANLADSDFVQACRDLAHHSWGQEPATNRIEILLDNLGSTDRDRLLERVLKTAATQILSSLPISGEAPYVSYVKRVHALVRQMGLGKNGALVLLDAVIAGPIKEKLASRFRPMPSVIDRLRRRLRTDYTAQFGTDNATGWDKVMHFVKSAELSFRCGEILATDAGVAKEVYDQAEHWLGKDPEGWSWPDVTARRRRG